MKTLVAVWLAVLVSVIGMVGYFNYSVNDRVAKLNQDIYAASLDTSEPVIEVKAYNDTFANPHDCLQACHNEPQPAANGLAVYQHIDNLEVR